MKKWIFGIAVPVVAAGLLGAPYYLGIKAEESLTEQHRALKETFLFDVVSHDYQRGWFGATETTVLRFHPSVLAKFAAHLPDNIKTVLDKPVVMVNHVKHGLFADGLTPVRAVVRTELQYDPAVQKILARFFGENVPATVHNTLFLDGSGKLTVDMAAFDYEELSGIKLNWKGLQAQVDYQRGWEGFDTQFTMPGMKAVLADKGEISFEQAALRSQSHYGTSGVVLGSSETKLAKFDVFWKDELNYNLRLNELVNMVTDLQVGAFINPTGSIAPNRISLSNLRYTTQTDEQQGFINGRGKFAFERLHYGDEQYGPLDIDIAANHIDAKSLMALKRRVEAIAREQHDDAKTQELMLAAFRNEGAGILTNNPEFKINQFAFQTPAGHVKADGNLRFKDLTAADLNAFNEMMRKTAAELNLDVSAKVLEQFAIAQAHSLFSVEDPTNAAELEEINETVRLLVSKTISSMHDDGYVRAENGAVQTQVKIADNQMSLNGKRFETVSDEEWYAHIDAAEGGAANKQAQPDNTANSASAAGL